MQKVIRIHPFDNILVALSDLQPGEKITYGEECHLVTESIPAKHKFTTLDIDTGQPVRMYGITIGKASCYIPKGALISTANVTHLTDKYKVKTGNFKWNPPDISRWVDKTFQGYHRQDGQVGTRNFWLVIPLVFCENRNIDYIKNAFVKKLGYARPDKYEIIVDQLIKQYQSGNQLELQPISPDNLGEQIFKNIDGIKFLTHTGGCGGTRQDSESLCKLIAGYIQNPNVAGATILSLGCQHLQTEDIQRELLARNPKFSKPILFFEQQKYKGEERLLQNAIVETFRMLVNCNEIKREPASLSKLCVGLKCGGSDGFSGITANPAMGYVSDILVAMGGQTVLAEFPELCGVEQELIDRSVNTETAQKFVDLMETYNAQAAASGSDFSMNPSPGNIKDGLITDAMKSAGAAKKGGTSPVADVLNYGEYIEKPGLNLLCTPGNDVEATTGMSGSGTNLIVFSTGLGTPTGSAIAPVVKTSTNTQLATKLSDLIDFDHGDIITSGKSIEQSGIELMELLIKVASGEIFTKAEILQQDDFIPWKRGVSL
jgi:altronate hydrolase